MLAQVLPVVKTPALSKAGRTTGGRKLGNIKGPPPK
jgi:hypothetical protein